MENLIKMDDLGGKPTILGNLHIMPCLCVWNLFVFFSGVQPLGKKQKSVNEVALIQSFLLPFTLPVDLIQPNSLLGKVIKSNSRGVIYLHYTIYN